MHSFAVALYVVADEMAIVGSFGDDQAECDRSPVYDIADETIMGSLGDDER